MDDIRILLGGIGDDSHSIGSSLINIALKEEGYNVDYIGIHNDLNDFIDCCQFYDVIMISCINGHTELYVNNSYDCINRIREQKDKLWYIGGNLSVDKSNEYIVSFFKEFGFDRVFPKPIYIEKLLEYLKVDLKNKKTTHDFQGFSLIKKPISILEQFMDDSSFFKKRNKVLNEWKTGLEVNDERTIKNCLKNRTMDDYLWEIHNNSDIAIQPRTGVADLNSQIVLLQKLQENGISIASVQLDSACRQKKFIKAEEGLEQSLETGQSILNGFPVPIHGVSGVEKLTGSINIPFQIRGGAIDHCLAYEIGICGGATGVEGGFLSYLLPYQKNIHPLESIKYWDYVDTLCGYYQNKYNLSINREFFGPLTTTLVLPSMAIVINIIETLFAAKRGVKSISVGLAEQGNRSQDIAAIRVLKKLTEYYLTKYSYTDCRVTTVFHQYMGAFPFNYEKSKEIIYESAITAKLAGATRIMTKTPVESFKIPNVYDNIEGINIVKKGIKDANFLKINENKVEYEMQLMQKEVISIMDYIENIEESSIELKAVKAVEKGIIDIMFSPNNYNCNNLICFRNTEGAIRVSNPDFLPFTKEIKNFHLNELALRMEQEKNKKLYSILSKDLTFIWKGDFKKWPLDNN